MSSEFSIVPAVGGHHAQFARHENDRLAIPDGDLKHSRPDILDDHLKLWRILGHRDGRRPKNVMKI
jgi:hypothetical protein